MTLRDQLAAKFHEPCVEEFERMHCTEPMMCDGPEAHYEQADAALAEFADWLVSDESRKTAVFAGRGQCSSTWQEADDEHWTRLHRVVAAGLDALAAALEEVTDDPRCSLCQGRGCEEGCGQCEMAYAGPDSHKVCGRCKGMGREVTDDPR